MRPTQEELKELLDYDKATGKFIWKVSRGTARAGTPAGYFCREGMSARVRIRIFRHSYKACDLAWLYAYGVWPPHKVTHADGNPRNNKLENLI